MQKKGQKKPILNTELFSVPLEDNNYMIYAPLRMAAFVCNLSMVNFLADLQSGHYNKTLDPDGSLVEFLTRLEIVNSSPEQLPVTIFENEPTPTTVTLFLTTACNLRCTYCYASAGQTPLKSMTFEVAKKGIDFIIDNALKKGEDHVEVAFHGGGEPTANWMVMTESFSYLKAKAKEFDLSSTTGLATNGFLRNEQIDWIIKNINSVSLSLDGTPEVHDKHRITAQGKGSSEKVIHTIKCFDAASYPYGLRLTVTKDNICNLTKSIQYICENFKPLRIQVEPSYQIGRWENAPSAETEEFIAAYRKAQTIANSFGFKIYYSAARVGTLTNHFCGVTQDSFALSPDGNVSACYEVFSEDLKFADTFFYGKPDTNEGYKFDLPVLNHLRKQAVQNRDYCKGCFAKWHCAGDCYHKSLTVNGKEEFTGSDRCHITRELTKDQVLEKIRESGGVFWHELPPSKHGNKSISRGKELLIADL